MSNRREGSERSATGQAAAHSDPRCARQARGRVSGLARAVVAALCLGAVLGGPALVAQQNRTVEGVVLDAKNNAVPQAIIYLKNARSRSVRTYITGDDGKYVFHALAPNTDYEIYAEYQQKRSSTRTVSSFDSRAEIHVDLKVPLVR